MCNAAGYRARLDGQSVARILVQSAQYQASNGNPEDKQGAMSNNVHLHYHRNIAMQRNATYAPGLLCLSPCPQNAYNAFPRSQS